MGDHLTKSSTLMCPHGGTVSPIPANAKVSLGDQIVLATDTFPIGACAFAPGGVPHPCVQVNWIVTALRATADGAAPLTTDCVGMCMAADGAVQGTVIIQTTQAQVGGL
ncbi:MAG TPA: hypothetical protein VKF16_00930 [Candidatus Dormibacteraeota bacterium]|nr:hypothetical protein [Candidatus Dormibacteraeota bacterium]